MAGSAETMSAWNGLGLTEYAQRMGFGMRNTGAAAHLSDRLPVG